MRATEPGVCRVGMGQFAPGVDVEANLATLAQLTASAACRGCDLVAFPEASMYAWAVDKTAPSTAMTAKKWSSWFSEQVSALAVEHDLTIVFGTFLPDTDQRARNILRAIGPDGQVIVDYHKVHLFEGFGGREADRLTGGSAAEQGQKFFDLNGIRFGMSICYDLRFPESYRQLVDVGAQVMLVPSAWLAGPLKEMHWTSLLRARAIENVSYVLGPGQCGTRCVGLSAAFDPFGVELAGLGTEPGLAVVDVAASEVDRLRMLMPSVANRQFTVEPGLPVITATP